MRTGWNKVNGIIWEELGSEALLVNPNRRTSWILNPVATFIWKHCNGATGIEQLARAFAKRGGTEISTIERELRAFCIALTQSGLIETVAYSGANGPAIACFGDVYSTPSVMPRTLGANGHRRASPRGNSGPG